MNFSRRNRKRKLSRARRGNSSAGTLDYQRLEDRQVLTAGIGLTGQYYSNPDLTGLSLVRVDPNINFDWGQGSYAAGGTSESFSVRWSGAVESQFTETYSFFVNANDGARLLLNGQLLIDQFQSGQVNNATATINLVAGRRYDIQMEYRESTGLASAKLEWSSSSLSKQVVPTSRLYPASRGSLSVESWNGIAGSSVTNLTSNINFPGNPSVVSSINSFETASNTGDNYGRRVRGYLNAPRTGPYTFYIAGNESAQLWLSNSADASQKRQIAFVNSATGVREWNLSATQRSAVVYLSAGQQYYIEALHKEAAGNDHLAVGWIQPGTQNIEVISGENLSPIQPEVRIYSSSPRVAEGAASPASFTVGRTGAPLNNPLTVNYFLNGSATNGTDYSALSGSITIPAGAESASLAINGLSDTLIEGDESVNIELRAGSEYKVGYKSERSAFATIQDNVDAPAGGIELLNPTLLSNFSAFGATFSLVNDSIEGNVIQAVVPSTTNGPWSIQLRQNIVSPVSAGDILLAEFRVRSVGGTGRIAAIFERNSSPYNKSLDQGLPTTNDWTKVQIPFVADGNYATGAATFGFFLGYQAQTLRFTDVRVVRYGPAKTLSQLDAFFLNNIGGNYGTADFVPVSGQPFDTAYRITTQSIPPASWQFQAVARNGGPVDSGDSMRFEFAVRAVSGASPVTQFSVQRTDNFATLYSQSINLTNNWQSFSINLSAIANFGASGLQAVFNQGQVLQSVEIGGFRWTNQNNLFDLNELPQQLPASSYSGRSGTDAWRKTAEDRISSERKGNLTINVNGANGLPLSGAVVSLRQNRHAFRFGSAIDGYNNRLDPNGTAISLKYQSEIKRLFNTVVFENSLKWPGFLENPQRAINGVNWAIGNGLYVRGHNLIWPSRSNMPTSVWSEYDSRVISQGTTAANAWLNTTINAHFDTMLNQFGDSIPEWDVVNEPWSNHDVMDLLGNGKVVDWFQQVRNFDPGIKLTLNDYGIFASNGTNTDHRNNFEGWLTVLRNASLLDVIGEQSHYSDSNLTDITVLASLINYYQTQFNAPIAITEFDVDTTDEQLQADYLRDYLTMSFSQSGVSEFLHWGFWESSHWLPNAALYRNDFSIKPNGQAYEDLVFGRWWSDVQSTTRDGNTTASVFQGEYDVLVEYNGQTYTATTTVDDSGASSLTLNLPVNAVNYVPVVSVDGFSLTGVVASSISNTGRWFEPDQEPLTLTASLGTVTKNADQTWSWSFTPLQRYINQVITITATDARGGIGNVSFLINALTAVSGRGLSYGGSSAFAGALASDKSPLLPGGTATFANYTSYELGLNRVVVDVAGLASSSLSVTDFEFRVGNNNDPNSWLLLGPSSSTPLPTISVSGAINGISRIQLTWPDRSIINRWLQVSMKATPATGLQANDVFYFGNAIGETGNSTVNAVVNLQDISLTRSNQSGFVTVPISNRYDFNRDGRVNLTDVTIARLNQSGFSGALNLITVPGGDGNRPSLGSSDNGIDYGMGPEKSTAVATGKGSGGSEGWETTKSILPLVDRVFAAWVNFPIKLGSRSEKRSDLKNQTFALTERERSVALDAAFPLQWKSSHPSVIISKNIVEPDAPKNPVQKIPDGKLRIEPHLELLEADLFFFEP